MYQPRPTIRAIAFASCRVAGVRPTAAYFTKTKHNKRSRRKQSILARMIFSAMAQRYTEMSHLEIARYFRSRHSQTVTQAIERWDRLHDNDEVLIGLTKRQAEQLFLVEMIRYDHLGPNGHLGGELLLFHSQQKRGKQPHVTEVENPSERRFWFQG